MHALSPSQVIGVRRETKLVSLLRKIYAIIEKYTRIAQPSFLTRVLMNYHFRSSKILTLGWVAGIIPSSKTEAKRESEEPSEKPKSDES